MNVDINELISSEEVFKEYLCIAVVILIILYIIIDDFMRWFDKIVFFWYKSCIYSINVYIFKNYGRKKRIES